MFEEGARSSCLQEFYTATTHANRADALAFELIAITDMASCPHSLPEQVERLATCPHKPTKLILRAKELTPSAYAALARAILPLCHQHSIQLILHTHWEIALDLGLKNLHMPLPLLEEMPFATREKFTISTSVHSLSEAQQALSLGAQSLVAGHIYATNCKAGVPPRGLAFLRSICSLGQTVYAIGGIGLHPSQWQELQQAGASGACIMSAYMQV